MHVCTSAHVYKWRKQHRKWSHSCLVTSLNHLMRLQSCEKLMGWLPSLRFLRFWEIFVLSYIVTALSLHLQTLDTYMPCIHMNIYIRTNMHTYIIHMNIYMHIHTQQSKTNSLKNIVFVFGASLQTDGLKGATTMIAISFCAWITVLVGKLCSGSSEVEWLGWPKPPHFSWQNLSL